MGQFITKFRNEKPAKQTLRGRDGQKGRLNCGASDTKRCFASEMPAAAMRRGKA